MSYLITQKCLGERYANCTSVCPVDCIKPGEYRDEEFMVIDPEACIDCGLCLPQCPVGAILESPEDDRGWADINAQLAPDFNHNPPVAERPRNEQPRKPGNVIVNP